MRITPIGFSAVAFAGETTCFMIETDGECVLLDVGTNPAYSLSQFGRSTTEITAVFLSHQHGDHMQGLPSLIFSRSVQARSASADVPPLSLIGAPEVLDAARQALAAFYPDREFPLTWIEATAGAIDIGALQLSAFRVDHAVPSYGAALSRGKEKLCAYSSDTALCDAVIAGCSGATALIVECFGTEADFGQMAVAAKHMCAPDAARLADAVAPRVAIPYHMHAPYRDPARRETLLAELRAGYDGSWRYPEAGTPIAV